MYGVWVNTDSFAVGEQHEVFLGMRIFEIAKQVKTLRHYVWSNLDYNLKVPLPRNFEKTAKLLSLDSNPRKEGMIPNTEPSITTERVVSPNG